jgi:hypothetical protein
LLRSRLLFVLVDEAFGLGVRVIVSGNVLKKVAILPILLQQTENASVIKVS